MQKVILILFIGLIHFGAYANDGEDLLAKINSPNTELDLNGDGKTDSWRTFKKGVLTKATFDSDFDGKEDTWIDYQSDKIKRTEDSDGDGKIDLVSTQFLAADERGMNMVVKSLHQLITYNGDEAVFQTVRETQYLPEKKQNKITLYENGKIKSVSFVGASHEK